MALDVFFGRLIDLGGHNMARFWKVMFLIASSATLFATTGCFQKLEHGWSFFPDIKLISGGITT